MTIKGAVTIGRTITGSVEKAEKVNVTELCFSNRFEFPNVGEPDKLYIATDENAIYRFDGEQNVYRITENALIVNSIQSKLKEE